MGYNLTFFHPQNKFLSDLPQNLTKESSLCAKDALRITDCWNNWKGLKLILILILIWGHRKLDNISKSCLRLRPRFFCAPRPSLHIWMKFQTIKKIKIKNRQFYSDHVQTLKMYIIIWQYRWQTSFRFTT